MTRTPGLSSRSSLAVAVVLAGLSFLTRNVPAVASALGVGAAFLVVLAAIRAPKKSRTSQAAVLSSPDLTDLERTRVALSALGLPTCEAEPDRAAETEADLLRNVALPRGYRDTALLAALTELSAGLFTEADQAALQIALGDVGLKAEERLPLLNSRVDPGRGRFYFADGENDRLVFLTRDQARALADRGWRIQNPDL